MLPHFHHSSFAHNLKSSICCFHTSDHDDFLHSPARSPCSWLPELLHRCRNLLARMARRRSRRRYLAAADFSYDSSSYALNFEDDCRHDDEFPFRDFTARLPPSPALAVKERVLPHKFPASQDGITVSACA